MGSILDGKPVLLTNQQDVEAEVPQDFRDPYVITTLRSAMMTFMHSTFYVHTFRTSLTPDKR